METSDPIRSIPKVTQRDREFEELLRRASMEFRRQVPRQIEKIRKKSVLDASAEPPEKDGFNSKAMIPFGLTTEHIFRAMSDFVDFLRFINTELASQRIAQFEDLLTTSNFSSIVSEFLSASIPKYSRSVVKNACHNGHPNILPADAYASNSVKEAGANGVEIRASRYLENWRRHRGEDSWLMMFVFQSGRLDPKVTQHLGFKFLIVAGGSLSGKEPSADPPGSSQTATSIITKMTAQKLMANWIYKCKELRNS